MKFKKLIAMASAVAMLGSFTVIPANAVTEHSTDKQISLGYTKIDMSKYSAYLGGSGTANYDATEDVSNLFDGDVSTTAGNANQKGYIIDLGEDHAPITKISVKGATTQAVFVSLTNTQPSKIKPDDKVDVLRTNNSTQSGCTSLEYTENEIKSVSVKSDYQNYRYILIYDWSNFWLVGELEVYTSPSVQSATVVRSTNDTYTTATTRTFDGNGVRIIDVWEFDDYDISNLFDGDAKTTCELSRNSNIDKDIFIDLGADYNINKLEISNVRHSIQLAYGSSSNSAVDVSGKSITLPYGYRLNDSYSNTSKGKLQDGTSVTFGTQTSDYWDKVTVSGITGGVRYIYFSANGSTGNIGELTAYASTSTYTYDVTAQNGINVSKSTDISVGEDITITTPDGYVDNSLVVYDTTNSKRVDVSNNTFTMPAGDVTVSCLTKSDDTEIILGTYVDRAFARANHDMNITYNVSIPDGKVVDTAYIYIPYKQHNYNGNDMYLNKGNTSIVQLQNTDRTINNYDVQGIDVSSYVTSGDNTFTVTNTHENGIDYYSAADAVSADKLTRLVVTFKDAPITEAITMTPNKIGSYTGDTDGSTAVAFKASFTSTTGDTVSFNVNDITWKFGDTALKVSDDNETNTVTLTLSGQAEVVYGIIIAGVTDDGSTLSAEFN